MADALVRRPVENGDRIAFADPGTQHFARLVPVDQEDEASADRFEKRVAAFGVADAA